MKICVSKAYGEKKIFENLALEFADGEVVCVLGASGVGKTTLLRILAGLTNYEGEVDGLPARVGYAFQEPRLLPHLTMEENLLYAGARNFERVLETTELSAHRRKYPRELSGGEKQRAALARAFAADAPLLLLDEPFSSLDTALKIRLWSVFARLWEEKKPTAVLVTHDLEEAWALGRRIVVLKDGKIAYDRRFDKKQYPALYGERSKEKDEILSLILGNER